MLIVWQARYVLCDKWLISVNRTTPTMLIQYSYRFEFISLFILHRVHHLIKPHLGRDRLLSSNLLVFLCIPRSGLFVSIPRGSVYIAVGQPGLDRIPIRVTLTGTYTVVATGVVSRRLSHTYDWVNVIMCEPGTRC